MYTFAEVLYEAGTEWSKGHCRTRIGQHILCAAVNPGLIITVKGGRRRCAARWRKRRAREEDGSGARTEWLQSGVQRGRQCDLSHAASRSQFAARV